MTISDKATHPSPQIGIQVGGSNKETITALHALVVAILQSSSESKVKITALRTIGKLCEVNSVSISNCSVTQDI